MSSHLVNQILAKPYARVITPDRSGGYAAQVLEFPGCFSDGDTPDEAYGNLQEAAENWLESALAQGMAIPEPFAAQGYSGTVSLRLPKSIHRRAAEYAHKDGVSLNQFLLSAIAARVGAEDVLRVVASNLDDRLDRLQRSYSGVDMLLQLGLTACFVTSGTTQSTLPVAPAEMEGAASSPQAQGMLAAGTAPTIELLSRRPNFAELVACTRGY
jgi:predicted RNase H-like HicB family nuclease